jgi:hypothetical protein
MFTNRRLPNFALGLRSWPPASMPIVAVAAAPQSIDQCLQAALGLLLQRSEVRQLLVELLIPATVSAGIPYPNRIAMRRVLSVLEWSSRRSAMSRSWRIA